MSWLEELVQRSRQLLHQAGRKPDEASEGPRIAVVTDSAASLPAEWAAEPETADWLRIVPMPVMISGQIYGEGVDDVPAVLVTARTNACSQSPRPARRSLDSTNAAITANADFGAPPGRG